MITQRLIVVERFRDEIEALSLEQPGGLERWRETGRPVEGGRGRSLRVELPTSRIGVHLRPLWHGGWLQRLTGRRFLATTRSETELEVATELRAAGAPVSEPVLVFARRRGLFWHIDVGTRFVEQSRSLARVLADADAAVALEATQAAGRGVRSFHDAGGSHHDLHTGNLVLQATVATLVDLDAARCLASVSIARRMRELMRFDRSLCKRHSNRPDLDRIRAAFLDAYIGDDAALRGQLDAHAGRERMRNTLHRLAWRR